MSEKLRVFEAFSGYGSQSIALRNIGVYFEVVAISEIDKYALVAYDSIRNNSEDNVIIPSKEDMIQHLKNHNIGYDFKLKRHILPTKEEDIKKIYIAHRRSKNLGDISKINIENIPKHDLFTYSFPCQDVSISGNQKGLVKGGGTRSGLLWECERIIESCKPKYLLMENVKNLVSKKFKKDFDSWLKFLETLGYKNFWKVIDSKNHNIPQHRERVFVVSILDGDSNYLFPNECDLTLRLSNLLDDGIKGSENFIIVDDDIKPSVRVNFEREKEYISKSNKDIYVCKCDSGWQDNKVGIMVAPTLRAGNSYTSVYSDFRIRKLNSREAFRFMGLRDEDINKIIKSNIPITQQYKLAGNSIVVQVLEDIFKNLLQEYI